MAKPHVTEFIQTYSPVAQRAASQLGIDPNILLAQWALETGWGKSILPGTHNLGNITDPSGKGVAAMDAGNLRNFKRYGSYEDFADQYAKLIQGKRYSSAVGMGSDIVGYATALKQGGYAEDPNYIRNMTSVYNTVTGANVEVPEGAAMPPTTAPPPSPTTLPASVGLSPYAVKNADVMQPYKPAGQALPNPVMSALGMSGENTYVPPAPSSPNNPFNLPNYPVAPVPGMPQWETEHLRQLIRNASKR